MSSVKPSRKIFFLVVACVVGVGTVGLAVYATKVKGGQTPPSISKTQNNSQVAQIIQETIENNKSDDDKDNLEDWEEVLWGTDTKNPDTDKDGTKDGDEIKANRNPLKAGPEDKLTDLDASTKTKAVIQVESDKTKTGEIGRELFSNYLEAKKTGATLDPQTQSKIINETFSNKSLNQEFKKYSSSDIKLSASSDLKTYGNNLGLAFYEGRTDNKTSEMEILSAAVVDGKQDEIEKLDQIINSYTAILKSLATVPVPQNLISKHLALLNSTSKLLSDIEGFRKIFTDPLVGVVAVSNYYPDAETFQQSIRSITTEFEKNNVTFDINEFGALFVKTIQ